jgi:riboflavin synthase
MFTGLIETTGLVAENKPTAMGFRLRFSTALASELRSGDSVAVNGVCLTVIASTGTDIVADVSPETVRVSTLGQLKPGAVINLERPLRADARLGGHFVLGHVDAAGTIAEIRPVGDCYWLTVDYPPALAPYLVRKGSVALDGISLTVAGLSDNQFDVQIIPYTWDHTNLRSLRARDAVNVECDVLGKYVARLAEIGRA